MPEKVRGLLIDLSGVVYQGDAAIEGSAEPGMDAGAFVAALEFASGREAVVVGKPAVDFFHLAAADMELEPHEVAMIGDDLEFDVVAAIRAGLGGILVRTGKSADASAAEVPPTADCADLREAVETVLAEHSGSER